MREHGAGSTAPGEIWRDDSQNRLRNLSVAKGSSEIHRCAEINDLAEVRESLNFGPHQHMSAAQSPFLLYNVHPSTVLARAAQYRAPQCSKDTETVGKVPYPAYPGYIPGVFHTRVRVGIVGMTSENT